MGQRRPPQGLGEGAALAGGREGSIEAGAGVHEQRRAPSLEAVEHGAHREQSVAAGERSGGQRDTDAAPVERTVDVQRIGPVERDRAPHPEGLPQDERADVIGLEQRLGLLARQALDPDRTRQAQQGTVEPVMLDELRPARRLLGAAVDHVRALAREVEHRQPALQPGERKLRTEHQLLYQRLTPEVLMNVGSHRPIENIMFVDLVYEL